MIVQLPATAHHLAAIHLSGPTRASSLSGQVTRGVLVLKGTWTLVGGDAEDLTPVPTTSAPSIDFADHDTKTADGVDLHRDGDVALEKAHADVVVVGWAGPGRSGVVTVDDARWMKRDADPPLDPQDADARQNLFGWTRRTEQPRAMTIVEPFTRDLPPSYTRGYNNFSRSGGRFTQTLGDRLPSGKTVTVTAVTESTGHTDHVSFGLPDLVRTARLRAWCGHGPDRAPFWRVVDDVELVPDTLIVDPANRQATTLWRASWRDDLVDPDHWRLVQVIPGGA